MNLDSRSVALEVVVDVDSDAGIAALVVARQRDLRWVSTTTTGDLGLSTANVLFYTHLMSAWS